MHHWSRHRLAVGAAILLVLLAGCGRRSPLDGAHASPEAVATGVLDALAQTDRAALERLAVTEAEFRERIWPELPAAKPERNLTVEYVWGDLHQKSRNSLTSVLARQGGRQYRLRAVTFDDATEYGSYRVHRKAVLQVTDPSGAEQTLRVCGSMIEADGRWKVFSYVVD